METTSNRLENDQNQEADPLSLSLGRSQVGSSDEAIFSISELNQSVKNMLETTFPSILAIGEISNLSKPRSGHWYFTLKDEEAQIRAAMFRFRNQMSQFTPKEGDRVIVRAKLSLYAPRGDYQLIVDAMQPAGAGALQAAFEALKQKLLNEGLFEQSHKRSLPAWPKGVGVITSATGAAIRDILHVLERRFPALPVYLFPVPVQGQEASSKIVKAIAEAEQHPKTDVIILARGGGSLEDLWCFNDETVARSIYACQKPLISGVGHETDFTIADFVADVRAPTPSAAAELVSPDQSHIHAVLANQLQQASQHMKALLTKQQSRLDLLKARLKHPKQKLEELQQTLDRIDLRLLHSITQKLNALELRLQNHQSRLTRFHPKALLDNHALHLQGLRKRLVLAITQELQFKNQKLAALVQQAQLVSPMNTLARGYTLTFDQNTGELIRQSKQVQPGQKIRTKLNQGEIISTVD